MKATINRCTIELVQGDITEESVDAMNRLAGTKKEYAALQKAPLAVGTPGPVDHVNVSKERISDEDKARVLPKRI